MTSHRLIPIIFCLLIFISYAAVRNDSERDRPRFIEALAGGAVFVANSGSDSVSVINPANNTVMKDITVGSNPSSIHRYGDAMYIANSGSNNVSVISLANNTVIKNIAVGAYPISIITSMNAIYVANGESNTVLVINPDNNTVIKNIAVGANPSSIYGFGDTVYVANGESNTVSVINPIIKLACGACERNQIIFFELFPNVDVRNRSIRIDTKFIRKTGYRIFS